MANERSVSLVQQLRVFRQGGARSEHTPETEIEQLFPTVKQSRKEATKFKRPFLCLTSPADSVVPSRSTQVHLSSIGLGPLWMTADVPAEMPGYLLPSEFHNLVLSMYPAVISCGYEVCRAGGANHTAVIPLEVPEGTSTGHSSSQYWCPERLKSVIKRRAKVIIHPLSALNLNEMEERPMKPHHVTCYRCDKIVAITLWDLHACLRPEVGLTPLVHVGDGDESAIVSSSLTTVPGSSLGTLSPAITGGESVTVGCLNSTPTSSHRSLLSEHVRQLRGSIMTPESNLGTPSTPVTERMQPTLVPAASHGSLSCQSTQARQSTAMQNPQMSVPTSSQNFPEMLTHIDESATESVTGEEEFPPFNINTDIIDLTGDLLSTVFGMPSGRQESLDQFREIRRAQDEEYETSLRRDREQERRRREALEASRDVERKQDMESAERREEEQAQELRVQEWRRRIRQDLQAWVPDEPPEGVECLSIRVRFEDGARVTRRFRPTDTVQGLLAFVGCNDSIPNPRGFRLLVANTSPPVPLMVSNPTTRLTEAGIERFTLLYAEDSEEPVNVTISETVVPRHSDIGAQEQRECSAAEFVGRTMKLEERRNILLDAMIGKPRTDVYIERAQIVPMMLKLFSDASSSIFHAGVFVEFDGERATDMDGLTRELFSLFWEEARYSLFEGSTEMIPRIDPQTCCNDIFQTLGRILSHGYLLTGYFPVFVAKASMMSAVCRQVSNKTLFHSFMNFVDSFEKEATVRMISGECASGDRDIIVCMLSRFKCYALPKSDNMEQLAIECANSELICRPAHAITNIFQGMMQVHPCLWSNMQQECLEDVYDQSLPTGEKVWGLIKVPMNMTAQEDTVFDYLRRFIFALKEDELELFLRFVTGCSTVTKMKINVTFCSQEGLARCPIVHTCTGNLQLATSYKTYVEFQREFRNVLQSSKMWFMDSH